MTTQRSLRAMMSRRLIWGAVGVLVLLHVIVGVVSHRQLHDHMDAMLLELAIMEAKLSAVEPGEVHIHGSPMYLPGRAQLAVRKGVVYDQTCHIVASTWEFEPSAARTMPGSWCMPEQIGAHRVDFITLDGQELRAASTTVVQPGAGRQLTFLVGIDHEVIDHAIWRLLALGMVPSVLLLLLLWGIIHHVARRVTRELEHLSQACTTLGSETMWLDYDDEALRHEFEVNADAPLELHQMSATLLALMERVQRTQRTQSRFIAEASHELRTPLTAIRGELEVTLRRPRRAEEYEESMQAVLGDVLRMQTLSEQLLTAAKARELSLDTSSRITLLSILDDVLHTLHTPLQDAQLTVHMAPECEHVEILADAVMSTRVLINLIHNALTHSRATRLELTVAQDERAITLYLDDNGVGVAPEIREHLFAPFQRAEHGSHGLGLYIARRLMHAQGGEISLTRWQGGSRWAVRFRAPRP
jgi:two-component system OmpR family sensor kinase